MTARRVPRVLSIPAGVPFLPTLAGALLEGRLVEGFARDGDPLKLAVATIYVPTRRAARALRSAFVDMLGGSSAILPVIRPLGEFDEDAALFEPGPADDLALAPPIEALDRVLLLAPLVHAWKKRLPAHVAALFGEDIVAPASHADAIWLARDLAALMDEVETVGADWTNLRGLAPEDLAHWWQVTLEFLDIVTGAWPRLLEERQRSNPAAHRNAGILAEAERLARHPPDGPVIAAGSTGSIPATARLLATIAHLPMGAVVLPGLDRVIDERSWIGIGDPREPASFGHPQAGLKRLVGEIGLDRGDVIELGRTSGAMSARMRLFGEAFRPAETTDDWMTAPRPAETALDGVTLVEAANEREEASVIAVAMRLAVARDRSTALVTGDRELARRVSAELRRFGIEADDSAGTPLARTPPATLFAAMIRAAYRPGDPVVLIELLDHPLLRLGMARDRARAAAEAVELVALRGGAGRPDLATLDALFTTRLSSLRSGSRQPNWLERVDAGRIADAHALLDRLAAALGPLLSLRDQAVELATLAHRSVECLEGLGRDAEGSTSDLYGGDAGTAMAGFLRSLVATDANLEVPAGDWPDLFEALVAGQVVKPTMAGDSRVAIWGTLEARLLTVDTLVIGGLNEGSWPRRAEPDRFMSRAMKAGLALDPPERRIGQSAHDFLMSAGNADVILTRSSRSGNAPAMPSRWLQRLQAFAGEQTVAPAHARGDELLDWARALDVEPDMPFAARPEPAPPVEMRPTRFSVTEIETLRRDPYAIYARRILRLEPIEPLLRDPGAAERGTLFHAILHGFTSSGVDPAGEDAAARLLAIGRDCFEAEGLPPDVEAVWWPRFAAMVPHFVAWERRRPHGIRHRLSEARASPTQVGMTGVTLSGYADRIDVMGGGMADILDYKTGAYPSKRQAHTLVSPQLALEGALLMRGAFEATGAMTPADLVYVRLKANGHVDDESVLSFNRLLRSAQQLADDAWQRLERLLAHYHEPANGYRSRALPFREADYSGSYDHLARVHEWASGGGDDGDGE